MATDAEIHTATEMRNAVATIVAGLDSGGPSLSERELLGLVVDFANGKPLAGPLAGAPDVPLPPPALQAINRKTGQPQGESRAREEFEAKHRAELRTNLAAAISKGGLSAGTFNTLRAAALQMIDTTVEILVEHKGRPRRQSLRFRRHYFPLKLEAILARTVLLLRDETLDLGVDLKKCALPTCGEFFFAADTARNGTPRGRPRVYCSYEHMVTGNNNAAAARMRKLRKRGN